MARRTASGIANHRKIQRVYVENSFKAGLLQHQRIGGIQDRRGDPAVLERQHPIVLPADGGHLHVPIAHAKALERQAQIEVSHVMKAGDADNLAAELLHFVDAGAGNDPILHAVVDARDE